MMYCFLWKFFLNSSSCDGWKHFDKKKKKKKKRKYLKWGHRKTILNVKVKGRFENEVRKVRNKFPVIIISQ